MKWSVCMDFQLCRMQLQGCQNYFTNCPITGLKNPNIGTFKIPSPRSEVASMQNTGSITALFHNFYSLLACYDHLSDGLLEILLV